MKKKVFTVSVILFLVFLIIATIFFFLMKNAQPSNTGESQQEMTEVYDVTPVAKSLEFLKLNSYEEIEKYAEESPIYIQKSDDVTLFGIGELYIDESPVKVIYSLNEDGSLFRFDGYYTATLNNAESDELWEKLICIDELLMEYFQVGHFDHSVFLEDGMSAEYTDKDLDEELINGKAKYVVSVIDENNTYWHISAVVTEKKQLDIEFFRCFDENFYSDDSPNIDLRVETESGVE